MLNEFEDLKITSIETLEPVIKKIESMIRTSKEYRAYIGYCKQNIGLHFTQTWEDIDLVANKISIEMHHNILTLYRLVAIVGTELVLNLQTGEYLLTWDIARAIIDLHLNDEVSIVSLGITDHELVHANLLDIKANNTMVHIGEYKTFIRKYYEYITPEEYKEYIKYGADPDFINQYISKV